MPEKLFERNSQHLAERNEAWEERDRYRHERNVLLLGLCEWMDEEAPCETKPQDALAWAIKEFGGEDGELDRGCDTQ